MQAIRASASSNEVQPLNASQDTLQMRVSSSYAVCKIKISCCCCSKIANVKLHDRRRNARQVRKEIMKLYDVESHKVINLKL